MTLEVVGAGLGRTGTASTKLALERLGFGPCYHMSEVIAEPSRMGQWLDAASGRADWDAVFEGYGACIDYPAATFWREIAAHYPGAKVVLNVRDPGKWFDSVNETILSPDLVARSKGSPQESFVRETIYKHMDHKMGDRSAMTAYFNAHVESVKEGVDAGRLLVYDVKQGWEPLCAFLGVGVPDEAFPRVNSREDTKRLLAQLAEVGDWDAAGKRDLADELFRADGGPDR